jgi:hypothetical protein
MRVRLKENIRGVSFPEDGPEEGIKMFFAKGTMGTVIGVRQTICHDGQYKLYIVKMDAYKQDQIAYVTDEMITVVDSFANKNSIKIDKFKEY